MFSSKSKAHAILAFYALSGTMVERRIDRKMFIRKIKKFLYEMISQKNNLILLGDFNRTLGNKYRSTVNKGFCESQEDLKSLITEFDLEELWICQNSKGHLYTHIHSRSNTSSGIDRAYTSTNLRVSVKMGHEINTFSD